MSGSHLPEPLAPQRGLHSPPDPAQAQSQLAMSGSSLLTTSASNDQSIKFSSHEGTTVPMQACHHSMAQQGGGPLHKPPGTPRES